MRINRGIALNSYAEITQTLFAFERNRLNNVAAAFLRQRLNLVAEALENCGSKNCCLYSLDNNMRCQEQALIKFTSGIAKSCAHLAAEAGSSQTIGSLLYQISTANNIAAGRSKAAAQVFNQRASHQVSANLSRLHLFDKFAVAVIYEADNIRIRLLRSLADAANLFDVNRLAHATVAAGALNMNHRRFAGYGLSYCVQVNMVASHRQLLIGHAQVNKRALALDGIADNRLHRIIRRTGNSNQLITCTQVAQKRYGQRMRTADKLRTHQCCLCFEQLRIDFVELVTANITVAIASGRFQIIIRNDIVTESGNNLFRVI